mgnify:CR=1 FL=1
MTTAREVVSGLTQSVTRTPSSARRILLVVGDGVLWVTILLCLVLVRYDPELSSTRWRLILLCGGIAMALQMTLGVATNAYLGRHRVGSFSEATWTDIQVTFTGLRNDEKLHEVKLSELEESITNSHSLISYVHFDPLESDVLPDRCQDSVNVLLGQLQDDGKLLKNYTLQSQGAL